MRSFLIRSAAAAVLVVFAGSAWIPDEAQACFSCSASNPNGVGKHNSKNGGSSKDGISSSFTPSGAYDGMGANVTQTKKGGSYSRNACCT